MTSYCIEGYTTGLEAAAKCAEQHGSTPGRELAETIRALDKESNLTCIQTECREAWNWLNDIYFKGPSIRRAQECISRALSLLGVPING